MRHLSLASRALTAIGILLVAVALILGLASWIALTGVLLAWAGVVKMVVVLIWTRVAGMETDKHEPIQEA